MWNPGLAQPTSPSLLLLCCCCCLFFGLCQQLHSGRTLVFQGTHQFPEHSVLTALFMAVLHLERCSEDAGVHLKCGLIA